MQKQLMCLLKENKMAITKRGRSDSNKVEKVEIKETAKEKINRLQLSFPKMTEEEICYELQSIYNMVEDIEDELSILKKNIE